MGDRPGGADKRVMKGVSPHKGMKGGKKAVLLLPQIRGDLRKDGAG
jgi:hypothetical protein